MANECAQKTVITQESKKAIAERLEGKTRISRNDVIRLFMDRDIHEKLVLPLAGQQNLLSGKEKSEKIAIATSVARNLKAEGIEIDFEKISMNGENDAVSITSLFLPQVKEAISSGAALGSKFFHEGDHIVMNAAASIEYKYSKKGSEGIIVKKRGKLYTIDFYKLTGKRSDSRATYEDIEEEYMEHKYSDGSIKENGGVDDFALRVTYATVVKAIADSEREKLTGEAVAELLGDKFLIKMNDGDYAVNQSRIFDLTGGNLAKAYQDRTLYSTPDMFSPPSERKKYVLRLELTTGCDYNACTYCDGYKDVKYKVKTMEEFMDHYEKVMETLGDYRRNIRRLFLGGGNALNVDLDMLRDIVRMLNRKFDPRRISIYGRADAIKGKGRHGLETLRNAGLNMIYWGAESGSGDVLRYVNKNTTQDEMLMAGYSAELAGISLSIMLMPGLGGIKHAQSHIDGTVKFLNDVKARFITFMAISAPENSAYSRRMAQEVADGINRPLTDREIVEQMKEIFKGMESKGQKIGMFDPSIDQVGKNPISFNLEFGSYGKSEAITICDRYLRSTD